MEFSYRLFSTMIIQQLFIIKWNKVMNEEIIWWTKVWVQWLKKEKNSRFQNQITYPCNENFIGGVASVVRNTNFRIQGYYDIHIKYHQIATCIKRHTHDPHWNYIFISIDISWFVFVILIIFTVFIWLCHVEYYWTSLSTFPSVVTVFHFFVTRNEIRELLTIPLFSQVQGSIYVWKGGYKIS